MKNLKAISSPVQNFACGRKEQFSFESKDKGRLFSILVHEDGWNVASYFGSFDGEVGLYYHKNGFMVHFYDREQIYGEDECYFISVFLREVGTERWHAVDKTDQRAVEMPHQLVSFFRQLCHYFGLHLPVVEVVYDAAGRIYNPLK